MNAVSSIDKLNAAKRLQQTLGENPNDIHALLELATLLGTFKDPDLDKKRKVLNRVLTLDPVNKTAREMLLEMDRAEFHASRMQPATQQTTSVSAPSVEVQSAKPLVFRYSIIHQILIYPLLLLSILFMFQAFGDWYAFLFFAGVFLLLLIPVWFVSAVVKVSSPGIKLTRLFGIYGREVGWKEVNRIEPGLMGVGMRLRTAEGVSLPISSQIHRYSMIVEMLRRIRPDLFDTAGGKIFQKGFFAKYGLFFFIVPATLMTPGAVLVPPFLPGILFAVVLFFMWRYVLYDVHLVKIEENRISTQSLRKSQELTAQQIQNISMISVRNRRGIAKTFVQIEPMQGSAFRLSGFPEGNEIMYGLLRNWWSTYQTSS